MKESKPARIFLLEDDPSLGEGLKLQFELSGFDVAWSKTVREALDGLENGGPFALALLDVNLSDGSGFEVCERIRQTRADLPVIFLTAKTDEDSVVRGFEKGANDYLRKPVGKRELMARIKNLLPGRTGPGDGWNYADVTLLKTDRRLLWNGKNLNLNRREYEILSCLFQNPERIVSRETLVSTIDRDGEIFDRTIDSHVSHIRSKLRKAGFDHLKIESVYGEGYRLGREA